MELEEAKNKLQEMIGLCTEEPKHITYNEEQAIEVILNHITKQEKMIENIFSYLDDNRIDDNICDEILNYGAKDCIHNGNCTECIKQYFEKKAEEEE